jgi:hypothetical protein
MSSSEAGACWPEFNIGDGDAEVVFERLPVALQPIAVFRALCHAEARRKPAAHCSPVAEDL